MSDAAPRFTIRPATEGDIGTVLALIKELAVYEKMENEALASPTDMQAALFPPDGGRPLAEALLCEENGVPVAFALFFHNFSTFIGRAGLYLEDIYVKPEYRGRGIGKTLFSRLATIARERGCQRFEWSCLDWNAPSIAFYEGMGAVPMADWTVYRLSGNALASLA